MPTARHAIDESRQEVHSRIWSAWEVGATKRGNGTRIELPFSAPQPTFNFAETTTELHESGIFIKQAGASRAKEARNDVQ